MTYELRPLTAEHGEAMANWSYPGPWAVYDVTEPIEPEEGFWAVVEDGGAVAGYACFGDCERWCRTGTSAAAACSPAWGSRRPGTITWGSCGTSST